jgi:hypothetical protein
VGKGKCDHVYVGFGSRKKKLMYHEDDAEDDAADDSDCEDEDEELEEDDMSFQPHARVSFTFLFMQLSMSLCKPLYDGLHDQYITVCIRCENLCNCCMFTSHLCLQYMNIVN